MVAYEDLVVALTNWRINQGLPTGSDAFAAFETGSVDLALPVADPVELSTGEVLAVDDDGAIEEVLDDQQLDTSPPADEVDSFDAYAEPAAAAAAADDAGLPPAALDYAEETAYGDIPQMDEAQMDAAPEADPAQSMMAEDGGVAVPEPELELEPLADPRTEEVDALAMEEDIDAALDASIGEMAAEEFVADELAIEEEVAVEQEVAADDMIAEEVDASSLETVEAAADDFDPDEMPTRFGDDDGDESESTVMGIGIDELRPADES